MNRNKALALAGIALVLIVALSFTGRQQSASVASGGDTAGFAGLDARLNEISRFEIQGLKGQTVTVSRNEDAWVVKQRDNFPANLSKVRQFLIQLAQAQVLETKTAKADNYERLGVQDYSGESADNAQIAVWAGDEALATIILGDNDSAGRGSYARLAGEAQSVLLNESIHAESRAEQWLSKKIADIPRSRLQRVDVAAAEQKPYSLVRKDGEKLDFALVADETAKLKSPESFRLTSVLENLSFTDLVVGEMPELTWSTTRYETQDGLRVTVQSAMQDSAHFLKLAAEYDAGLVIKQESNGETGAEQDKDITSATQLDLEQSVEASTADVDPATVPDEAEALAKLTQGRIFKVAAYKSNNLRLKLANLLTDDESSTENQ